MVGTVSVLERNQPRRPLAGVLFDLEGVKDFTSADGIFELTDVPDLAKRFLTVREQSGLTYYAIETDELEIADQYYDILLFPRGFITIREQLGDRVITSLEWLREMSRNSFGSGATILYRWPTYPIPLYVHDFEYVNPNTQELVDYRVGFEIAADRWNQAVGEAVFEIVDAPVEYGVEYVTDLPSVGALHGSAEVIRPIGGSVFESIPEKMLVHLQSDFPSQRLATRVIAHELGHVLYLGHSTGRDHVMNTSAAGNPDGIPHADEGWAARLISQMPQTFDAAWFRDESIPE